MPRGARTSVTWLDKRASANRDLSPALEQKCVLLIAKDIRAVLILSLTYSLQTFQALLKLPLPFLIKLLSGGNKFLSHKFLDPTASDVVQGL
jgi:hypothetical protein